MFAFSRRFGNMARHSLFVESILVGLARDAMVVDCVQISLLVVASELSM